MMPDIAIQGKAINPEMALRFVLLLGLMLILIPYGGVYDQHFLPGLALVAIAFALSALRIGAPRADAIPEIARCWRWIFLITLIATAYALLQSLQLPGKILAHGAWDTANELLGTDGRDIGGSISVDPAATRRAMLGMVMPALVLMAVLGLYRRDDDALRLMRILFAIGAVIAVFGILEHLVAPDRLLLMERRYRMRGVTGVFVNVNTAATFFGVAALMGLGLCLERFRRIAPGGLLRFFAAPRMQWSDPCMQFLSYLTGLLAIILALVLTQSRGGVAAAFTMILIFMFWASFRYGLRNATMARRLAAGGLFAAATFTVLAQMASRTALRIEEGGFEDARFCLSESAMRAIADHWVLGSGLGTFETIFPLYRDPACAFGRHIDMAHNSWIEGMLGLGIVFPLLVIAIVAVFGHALWGARRRRRYRFSGVVGAGILGLISLHAIVDFSLQIPGVAAYAAACIGAAIVLANGRGKKTRRNG